MSIRIATIAAEVQISSEDPYKDTLDEVTGEVEDAIQRTGLTYRMIEPAEVTRSAIASALENNAVDHYDDDGSHVLVIHLDDALDGVFRVIEDGAEVNQ